MRSALRPSIALLALVAFGLDRPAAAQTTYSWANPTGGNWNVGANWSGGLVPGSGQNAVISLAGSGPYTVSLTDNRQIGAVTVNQSAVTLAQSAGDLTATAPFSLQAGTMHLTGGKLIANGGLTTTAGTTIRLDGGKLYGNIVFGGSVTFNGTLDWSAGELHGPGSTTATFPLNGPVNLIGTGTRLIESRGLTQLNGGGTWDAGQLDIDSFTQNLELPAGSTITNTTASGNFLLGGGSVNSIFNIRGSFIKRGANVTTFSGTKVNNLGTGTIDVQAGRLRILGYQGTHSGLFQVGSGATLEFGAGQTLNSGRLNVLGGGEFVASGSTTTIASAVIVSVASTATVRVLGGGLDFEGTSVNLSPQTLEVAGSPGFSRLTVRGTTSPRNLIVRAGGEIWGGGQGGINNDLSVGASGGSFTWESGQFAFLRNVTIFGPASFPGAGHRELVGNIASGVVLNMSLRGVSTWDAGTLELNGRAGITIPAGATLTNTTASGNFSVVPPDATAAGGFISIEGTFIKQGTNTLSFGRDIDVSNTGHMDIRGGTVVVTTELRDGGRYTLHPGTTLQSARLNVWGTFAKKGQLDGVGTVVTPEVRVDYGGRIRPGLGGPGVLTVGGNGFVNVTAHDDTLGGPPRFVIETERTGPGTANSGRVNVTGTGKINFNFPGTTRFVEFELVGTGLHTWETYELVVATAGGGFSRNLSFPNLAAGYEFPTTDYRIIHSYPGLQDVKLLISATDPNRLMLRFTPVPEPATVLGLAAGVLGLGGLVRRRFRREG